MCMQHMCSHHVLWVQIIGMTPNIGVNVVNGCCNYNSSQVSQHVGHVDQHTELIYQLFLDFSHFIATIMDSLVSIMDFAK